MMPRTRSQSVDVPTHGRPGRPRERPRHLALGLTPSRLGVRRLNSTKRERGAGAQDKGLGGGAAQNPWAATVADSGRCRKRSPSTAPSSSDSDFSSESSSSSEEERHRRHRHRRKAQSPSPPPRRWKSIAYQHQHGVNREMLTSLRKAKAAIRKRKYRQAEKYLEKRERVIEERQEWLLVADFHGYEVANRFSGVGGLTEIMSTASKRKRLEVALAGVKQPFQSRTSSTGQFAGTSS